MNAKFDQYLLPTDVVDSDNQLIVDYAVKTLENTAEDDITKAIDLYYAVRDAIWYDPYLPFYRPEHYRASGVLQKGRAFCVGKAALLCALGRASGIPSRLGFADVRNHLATKQLLEFLGSDLFVYHGFTEFLLNDQWVRATPAFNIELCKRAKVLPLEFNGREDSIFHEYNQDEKRFMEYIEYHGSYTDVPVEEIVAAWKRSYGEDRVRGFIDWFEASDSKPDRIFDNEDIVDP
jgi:transglutaminase-like putative cysteine protease